MTKAELRHKIKAEKAKYSASELHEMSEKIILRVLADDDILTAQNIMLYYPLPDEVDTVPLMERLSAMQKNIFLPVTVGNDMILKLYDGKEKMAVGAFGIMEPVTEEVHFNGGRLVVIVPGVAFDEYGHRLGRGKGYYDRWFNACKPAIQTVKIGLCFPFQIQPDVPHELHDVMMDKVIF